MSEHEDRWPGPRWLPGAAGEPSPSAADSGSVDPAASDPAPAARAFAGPSPDAVATSGEQRFSGVGLAEDVPAGSEDALPLDHAADPLQTDTGAPAAVKTRSDARRSDGRRSVSRPVLIWSLVAGVVVVAAAAAAYLLLRDDGASADPAPVPTVTHTLPAPTATTEPVVRGEGTALFTALPGVVRQYVLTEIVPGDLAAQGTALETYDLTYQGDLDEAAVGYTVQVTQWATPEEAAAAAAALSTPLAPASSTGDVLVDGLAAGGFSLFGEDGTAAETGQAVWTNGTVVLHASGPALDIRNFYLAYGL